MCGYVCLVDQSGFGYLDYAEFVSTPSSRSALLASVFFGISGAGAGLSDLRVSRDGDVEEIQDLQLELGELRLEDLDEGPSGVAELVPGNVGEDLEDPVGGRGGAAAQLGI